MIGVIAAILYSTLAIQMSVNAQHLRRRTATDMFL